MTVFERFTDQARAVVVDARQQACRLGHDCIGGEHLLLALVRVDSPVAADLRARGVTPERVESAVVAAGGHGRFDPLDREALASIGIDLDAVRSKVESVFGPGALRAAPCRPRGRRRRRLTRRRRPDRQGHVPFTATAKSILELSLRQATELRCPDIGVEHIALALTSINDVVLTRILTAIGVSPPRLHADIAGHYRRAG